MHGTSIGKLVVRIKHLGIVNILAKREVVRELVQGDLNADSLAQATLELLNNTAEREQLQRELAEVVAMLGNGGAYMRAAKAVHEVLSAA